MAGIERIYRRTDAGRIACEADNSGLPSAYRRILKVLEVDIHSSSFRTVLACYSDKQISGWLDELETLGFVESRSATPEHDLDFTASFRIAELFPRPKAA